MSDLMGLDVIIVGGGSLGICAAYFLQRAGMRVTLLGVDSTDLSVQEGALRDVFTISQGCDTQQLGAQLLLEMIREIGYRIEFSDGAGESLIPSVTNVRCPSSGADVLLENLVADITDVIRERGVRIVNSVTVLDPVINAGKVVGVITDLGQFLSDEVVICASGLSSELERRYGFDLGPKHHQIAAARHAVCGAESDQASTQKEQDPYLGRFEEAGDAIIAVGHKLNPSLAVVVGSQISQMVARPWEYRLQSPGLSFA